MMTKALIFSSYVASSRVGGGNAPYILPLFGIEPILVPTVIYGRHPGWGKPGGSAVSADDFSSMIDAIEVQGLFEEVDGILTGYFASTEQVEIVTKTIEKIKAYSRHNSAGNALTILVDPVLGDQDNGLYIKQEVAEAIKSTLLPLADFITPNAFELEWLSGRKNLSEVGQINALRKLCNEGIISSASVKDSEITTLYADQDRALKVTTPYFKGPLPNGVGDCLSLRLLAGLIGNESSENNLAASVGGVSALIEKAVTLKTKELPLAQYQNLIHYPPAIEMEEI